MSHNGSVAASFTETFATNALALIFYLQHQLEDAIKGFQRLSDLELRVQIIREALERNEEDQDTEGSSERIKMMCLLLQGIGTDAACGLLLELLNGDEAKTRAYASEALGYIVCSQNPAVAMRALNLAIDNPNTLDQALLELPTIFASCRHPDRVKVCSVLLQHRSADVVARAIEGLVSIGDPGVLLDLRALSKDDRPITSESSVLGSPDLRVRTVGDLAQEAVRNIDITNRRLSIVD